MALNERVHSAKGECALYTPSFLVILFSENQGGQKLWALQYLPTYCCFSCLALYFGDAADLDHELRERKPLNLHYGASDGGEPGKDLPPNIYRCSKGRLHVGYEQVLFDQVLHRCPVLRKYFLDVGVCLTHLNFHVPNTEDVALVVMAYLSGEVDGVACFHRLRVAVLFFPRHTQALGFFAEILAIQSATSFLRFPWRVAHAWTI